MSAGEKKKMMEPDNNRISISKQCELLRLPRSSYYLDVQEDESEQNLKLMRLIDEEYTKHPFLGTRKMRDFLRRKGHKVNRKRVQRLMRIMGIQSVAPKPNTSKPMKKHKIYPYLLGGLDINYSNHVWCADVTYLRMPGGFVYLVAVMDWYSRNVLSWEVSITMDDSFCVSALERAIRIYGKPKIFNTDQGSQFTGDDFTDVLKNNEITISMDGKGRAMDNIMIERLWRSVKYEEIYLNEYSSVTVLKGNLKKYFLYYNTERTHASFGEVTPSEVYSAGFKIAEAA